MLRGDRRKANVGGADEREESKPIMDNRGRIPSGLHGQMEPVFLLDIQPGGGGGNSPPPDIFCWCKFLNVVPALLADTAVFFS